MTLILGQSDDELTIDSVIENRDISLRLAEQASLSIDIFTQQMDPEIYDNNGFEQAITKLARRHPKTRVRILAQDTRHAAQNGHCLVRIAQTLSSTVSIHLPARHHQGIKSAFMIVDRIGYIRRIHATDHNYTATVCFDAPRHSQQLADDFDEMWEHSTPDPQTRRLYV